MCVFPRAGISDCCFGFKIVFHYGGFSCPWDGDPIRIPRRFSVLRGHERAECDVFNSYVANLLKSSIPSSNLSHSLLSFGPITSSFGLRAIIIAC